MQYRPEIDGLRAVAVLPVLLFHAGFPTFSGGFVGVDVFFVISGYLITTIILSEMEQGNFSLANFYERRARRILPAIFLVMLFSLPFAWLIFMPSDMRDFSSSLAAVSTFSSNFLFWNQSGYWDLQNELKPLLHTWSLAVEEQYYVLFPLFLLFMWRFRKRWILGIFIIVAALSFFAAQWGSWNLPEATFYLLPTRGWELAIGACIAFYFLYRKQAVKQILSYKLIDELLGLAGLLMIGFSVFVFTNKTPFPGVYALVPTIGTGLIIIFSSSQTIVGKLLSSKILVAIGMISYSLYLWHQPLFAFVRYMSFPTPGESVFIGLILITFVLSYLSWKYVEKPFRNKKTFGRKEIFLFSIVGSLGFIGIGLAGYYSDGFPERSVHTRLYVKNYQPDNRKLAQQSWDILRKASNNEEYAVQYNDYDKTSWFTNDLHKRNILIVGNSHSKDIYNILKNSEYAKSHFQIARFGTQISHLVRKSPLLFTTPNYKNAAIVILASRYGENDLSALEQVVKKLINDRKKVVIVRSIFEFDYFNNKTIADNLLQRKYLASYENGVLSASQIANNIDKAYYANFLAGKISYTNKNETAVIQLITQKYNGVVILDRMNYICDKETTKCFSINKEFEKYFYDYGHHTLEGAAFFAKRIDKTGWLNVLGK